MKMEELNLRNDRKSLAVRMKSFVIPIIIAVSHWCGAEFGFLWTSGAPETKQFVEYQFKISASPI